MNRADRQSAPPPLGRILADRCKALALPAWLVDATGALAAEPAGWGPADEWLQAPSLRDMVLEAAETLPASSLRRHVGLFRGCWLLVLERETPEAAGERTVALALGRDAFDDERFLAVCELTRLSKPLMQTALTPLARYRRRDLDHLAAVLGWMVEDLERCEQDRVTLRAFSRDLVEAYEHVNLMYRLCSTVNHPGEPMDFVNLACSLLREYLEFAWVGLKFGGSTGLGSGLDRALLVAGHLPCDRRRLDDEAAALLKTLSPGPQPLLLDDRSSPLARLAESEVIIGPVRCRDEVVGVIMAGNKMQDDPDVSSIDLRLVRATTEYITSFLHGARAYAEQRTMFLGTIRAITSTIEASDRYTRGHAERVAWLAAELARAHGLSDAEVVRVRLCGLLHDVGKIGIPQNVLGKEGPLTDEEFAVIKRHPEIGYTILKDIEPLKDVLPGVRYHHEQWDGNGYPHGLSGESIPLLGRMIAVADVFDAMNSEQSRPVPVPRERIFQELEARAGSQLDPAIVRLLLALDLSEYDELMARHLEQGGKAA